MAAGLTWLWATGAGACDLVAVVLAAGFGAALGAGFAAVLVAGLAAALDAGFVAGLAADVLAGGFLVVAFLAGVVLT